VLVLYTVRRATYGDSDDRMFDEVESEKRWGNFLRIEFRRLETN
jgi:hypothetical protein